MDNWEKKEALKAIENKERLEELYGINFQQISEKISLINDALTSSMSETMKVMRSISQLPKIEFPILKYDIPKILDQTKFPVISKSLTQELSKINSTSLNFLNNSDLMGLSRQYQNLINSKLNTAIFASSFKNEELNLLKQFKFDLPEFPKVNLSSQTLSNLAEILNQNSIWKSFELLRNTYIGNLAISMREAIVDSSSNEEAIKKIESLYKEKVVTLPRNHFLTRFFREQFFAIIFLIISMWYSNHLSQQTSIELQTFFGEVFSRLDKIEKSNSDNEIIEEDEIYYIAERTTSVKNRSDFKSITTDYLSSDTKVRLLKSKHKWIYIEYIDHLEVIPRYGWVNKKYLKRLEK